MNQPFSGILQQKVSVFQGGEDIHGINIPVDSIRRVVQTILHRP